MTHDPRPHLDGILNALTLTNNEQLTGEITDQHANSVYLGAIAATLTTIGRTLADIRDALTRPADKPTGACPAAIETPYSNTITDTDPCIYLNGHTGAHRDTNGATWHTEPIRVARCQHHSTDGRQCTLTHQHPGIGHTDLTGIRWTNDDPTPTRMLNTDKQCTHTPDGDRRCLLDTGHPGQHITRTRGTDPCTADNGQAAFNTSRCARDADHHGPHTTYAGKDF